MNDDDINNDAGLDDCDQLTFYIVPRGQVDEATKLREAFNECLILNPDPDDSQDEDNEELFTKEFLDNMENN